jgi:phosphoribosylformylglycinamidine synthase
MVNGVKAKVIVMPKAAVLDPQGNAVRDAMRHLGMPEVRSVRIGKYMEIDIDGQNGDFESRLHRLCRDLLSNPVIEDYELQQTDVGRQKSEVRDQKKTPNSDKSRAGAQRPTPINREQASNAQLRKASRARHPKSKTKRTRLRSPRRPTARQARKRNK